MKKIAFAIVVLVCLTMLNSATEINKPVSFLSRPTIEKINNEKGMLMKVEDASVFVIQCKDRYLRLNAINIPEKFSASENEITFSGNIKYTNPLEDEWGQLFEITDIHISQP